MNIMQDPEAYRSDCTVSYSPLSEYFKRLLSAFKFFSAFPLSIRVSHDISQDNVPASSITKL